MAYPLISYFEHIRETSGVHKTMDKVFSEIKSSAYLAQKTRELRALYGKEAKKYTALKSQMPSVTFGGLFVGGREKKNLNKVSGALVLDFDAKDNPHTDLLQERTHLKTDPYIIAFFVSPSGVGLKVIVKYDTNNGQDFISIFKSAEGYFKTKYKLICDKSGKDITRLCFLCYDKYILINPKPQNLPLNLPKKLDTSKLLSKLPRYNDADLYEQLVELAPQSNICDSYDEWVETGLALADGFGERGRGLFHAFSQTSGKYDAETAEKKYTHLLQTHTGAITIGTLVYRLASLIGFSPQKGKSGKKTTLMLPSEKKDIRRAHLNADTDKYVFFNVGETSITPNDGLFIKICSEILQFKWVSYGDITFLAQFKGSVINKVEYTEIYKCFKNHLATLPAHFFLAFEVIKSDTNGVRKLFFTREEYQHLFSKYRAFFFSELILKQLPTLELLPAMIDDPADACYQYFQNTAVKTTSEGSITVSYEDLAKAGRYVFSEQILDRNYTPAADGGDTALFFERASGGGEKLLWLRVVMGYLAHKYYNNAKAVIFTDSKPTDNPEGRTGKSLLALFLRHSMENLEKNRGFFAKIDGKNFDVTNKFKYSSATPLTRLISLQDVKKKYKVQTHYNEIFEGFAIDKKNEKPFVIRAKLLISTNTIIDIEGGSSQARFLEVPLTHYYNEKNTPDKEFGRFFFYGWDAGEWARYDKYMSENVRLYFQYIKENGALRTPPEVQRLLQAKKLRDCLLPSVLEWVEVFNEGRGFAHRFDYLKSDLYTSYQQSCTTKAATPRTLWSELRKLKKYSEKYVADIESGGVWLQEGKKLSGRTIHFIHADKIDKELPI